ncbi:MAG: thiaminase II, partial [Trichococcus flocculiformis]
MTFSAQIRQAVEPIWAASMKHPFVKGIGDGSLPLENFRFYIQQDSYYLTRFAKILALGAAKAPDIATTNQFADFAKHTYSAEIGLHEQFSKRLGITAEEKELFKPAP